MDKKPINQHKRLAMGDTVKGYAKGGSVGMGTRVNVTPVGSSTIVPKPSGKSASPLTTSRRNNGIKGC